MRFFFVGSQVRWVRGSKHDDHVGLHKTSNTIFVALFVIFRALVCDSCCRCFFFARLNLLSTTILQCTSRGPGPGSGPPKLARDPWETAKSESCGGATCLSQGPSARLGREPERLYSGPNPPSTSKGNLRYCLRRNVTVSRLDKGRNVGLTPLSWGLGSGICFFKNCNSINSMFYRDCNDSLIEWCVSRLHDVGQRFEALARPRLGVSELCLVRLSPPLPPPRRIFSMAIINRCATGREMPRTNKQPILYT